MEYLQKPSDLINDEILLLGGTKTKLRLALWEVMKVLAREEMRQEIAERRKEHD